MSSDLDRKSWWILTASTLSFTICFAVWMLNGVLITFLVDHGIFKWGPAEMGWLIGIPVLTGAVFRLPLGVATDRWGGRLVNTVLLLVTAVPMFLLGSCNTYWQFFFASLGFGLAGSSFAVGIAYTSAWFPRRLQGTALGIFGSGNAGAALTVLIAPYLLGVFTAGGENPEGWRWLPRIYAGVLVVTAIVFLLTTTTRIANGGGGRTLVQRLRPLASMRIWRFGLYYFFVFGGFVALAQWLVPYYVNAYGTTVVLAGILTAIFSFPSGVIRALGGWMSDRWGARPVLYWVFGSSIICCALLIVPQMDIHAPGSGVMARRAGVVSEVTANSIVVESDGFDPVTYEMSPKDGDLVSEDERCSGTLVFPRGMSWHEPTVEAGQQIGKKELIARGVTHIFFQANIWIFTALCFIIGSLMGIGKAAVYKHIPEYFPEDVGVAAGMVGVLGGLGGFVLPVIFGYLLRGTGLWTTSWMFLLVVACICLMWMHRVVRRVTREHAPELLRRIE
ncbi:MAG: NarK/NasA family nitrate transporter [Planctomycetes bacterium]|nr:NarK/NasA family nitrate transporter [Planctomycetota bacterium]